MSESLNDLAKRIRYHNDKQGFTVTKENIDQKLLLVISEICEAQNELRDGHALNEIYYSGGEDIHPSPIKPEGFPVEIADAIIRLLDITHAVGIDIDYIINLKLDYNQTRPPKHGRQF